MRQKSFLKRKYTKMLLAYLSVWLASTIGDMADAILAGILISEEAVSAVELVLPVFSILMFVCSFLAVGTSTLFVRAMGAFDSEKAYRISGTGLLAAVFCGALLAGGMLLLQDVFFGYYTSAPAVEALAREYYLCLIPVALLYPVHWLLYYLIAGDGDANLCLFAELVNAGTNLLFSALLQPRYGIRGLSFGTAGAMLVSTLVLLLHFLRRSNSIRFRLCFKPGLFGQMAALGSASSLTYLYIAVVDIVLNKFIIVTFGNGYLAAYAVVNLVLNLMGCFTCAASAAGPFVGVGYGENNPLAIRRVMHLTTVSVSILGVCFAAGLVLLAPRLPDLYGIADPVIRQAAIEAGRILGISHLATCFVVNWIHYLPRVNHMLLGNVLAVLYMLITPLVIPIPFGSRWGFTGLTFGFALTPVVTMLFYVAYVLLRYGPRQFPYLIPDTKDRIFIHELTVREADVIALCDAVERELADCGIRQHLTGRIRLLLEESFLIVRDRNPGKEVLGDCTLIVSDRYVRLITRDNGVIFDITDVNAEIKSLRAYMNARLRENGMNSRYLTTTSFNRNSYIWERDDAAKAVSADVGAPVGSV